MQSDQPTEPSKLSKKDRRGKKNKKKKHKSSKGKRKGKGKGKKGSRKKKHEEKGPEEDFLRVTTTPAEFQPQEPFQPTELPQTEGDFETLLPTDQTTTVMPTHKPDFIPEGPTVVPPSSLPISKLIKEVDKSISRCYPL